MVKQRLLVALGTARGAVGAGATKTVSRQIPFPFKVAYLRIEHFVGQAGYLRTSVHMGSRGSVDDFNLVQEGTGGVAYLIGDGSVREFMNIGPDQAANCYVTAHYSNTHGTDAFTGAVELVLEEV